MVKVTRSCLAILAFSALLISQIPNAGQCQMGNGSILAMACSMPCCKAKMPMRNCPMMKASPTRDFIASSSTLLDNALIPLPEAVQTTFPGLQPLSHAITNFTTILELLFAGPPLSVRAPPADAHLLDA